MCGGQEEVVLAAPLASTLLSPKRPSVVVASTIEGGGLMEAISAHNVLYAGIKQGHEEFVIMRHFSHFAS